MTQLQIGEETVHIHRELRSFEGIFESIKIFRGGLAGERRDRIRIESLFEEFGQVDHVPFEGMAFRLEQGVMDVFATQSLHHFEGCFELRVDIVLEMAFHRGQSSSNFGEIRVDLLEVELAKHEAEQGDEHGGSLER